MAQLPADATIADLPAGTTPSGAEPIESIQNGKSVFLTVAQVAANLGVSNVATGAGLTGGPITTTGTIALAAIADATLLANVSGGPAAPSATTPSAVINTIGAVQGEILYRDAAGWQVLAPGTSGFVLTAHGAAANPTWAAGGGGTVQSVAMTVPADILAISGSPITTTGTLAVTKATQAANLVFAGPTSGGAVVPTFRALVGGDLPNPGAGSLGGIQSLASVASRWINTISTSGVPSATQPAFTDISGTVAATQLPNPSATTLGGIQSLAAVGSKWINAISTAGVPSATQPAFTDISGNAVASQLPIISTGTVLGNVSGISAPASANTLSTVLDIAGTAQGDILYRDSATWQVLAPGTSGYVLTTAGAGANPSWTNPTTGGTVTSVATNNGLTGGTITTTGTVGLASIADKRVLANVSGGSAVPIANTVSAVLDAVGAVQGDVLYRGASTWAVLAPGTNGQVLQTTGAGGTPQWANAGTVSSVATGWGLTGGTLTTTGTLSVATTNPPYGFDAPINLRINATAGATLLTVAIKGNNGSDPSSTNPVLIPFRNTSGGGDPVWVAVTGALSMDTNAAGASLGSTSGNVPFRLWVVAFNNGGSAVLALWQSVTGGATPTAMAALAEGVLQSATDISGTATSAGTFYCKNGTGGLTSKAFRILGYLDYPSGLTTAGTYASTNPTTIQLFGPGISKPGATGQVVQFTTTSQATTTSNSFQATNLTASITPTSAPNLVRVEWSGSLRTDNGLNADALAQMFSASTAIGPIYVSDSVVAGSATATVGGGVIDAPGTASSQTYTAKIKNDDALTTVRFPHSLGGAILTLTEIMA